MEQKDKNFFMLTPKQLEELSKPTKGELLEQENADQAFEIMLIESKAAQQEQDIADLQFTLMIGGII